MDLTKEELVFWQQVYVAAQQAGAAQACALAADRAVVERRERTGGLAREQAHRADMAKQELMDYGG